MSREIETKPIKMRVHSVQMDNRERASISGVSDVESFNESEVTLQTDLGTMVVTGDNLHISRLNLDEGQLIIEGTIGSVEYEDIQNRGGLFSRMFK